MAREQRFIRSIKTQGQLIALDAGSANTRIKIGDKVIFNEPTCLAVHRGSLEVVAVGKKAYQLLGKSAAQIEVIFPIQYGATASSKYFQFFLQAVSKILPSRNTWIPQLSGQQIKVALPDALSPVERNQILSSLKASQLGKIIPVSAAIAAASSLHRLGSTDPVCLIHVGGQTTQVTVVGGGEVAISRKYRLGGLNFTDVVQETIRQHDHCGISWHLAEAVKREIAFVDSPILSRTVRQKKMSVQGKDITSQLGKTVVVAAESFLPGFEVVLSDLLINLQLFFAELPTELATTALSSGVVLTGGCGNLTGLSEFISSNLQTEVSVSASPQLDVLNGLLSA